MAATLSSLTEEYEDYRDALEEYEEVLGEGDIEALDIHEQIGAQLKQVSYALRALRRAEQAEREELEDVEDQLGEIGDAFVELAACL